MQVLQNTGAHAGFISQFDCLHYNKDCLHELRFAEAWRAPRVWMRLVLPCDTPWQHCTIKTNGKTDSQRQKNQPFNILQSKFLRSFLAPWLSVSTACMRFELFVFTWCWHQGTSLLRYNLARWKKKTQTKQTQQIPQNHVVHWWPATPQPCSNPFPTQPRRAQAQPNCILAPMALVILWTAMPLVR